MRSSYAARVFVRAVFPDFALIVIGAKAVFVLGQWDFFPAHVNYVRRHSARKDYFRAFLSIHDCDFVIGDVRQMSL